MNAPLRPGSSPVILRAVGLSFGFAQRPLFDSLSLVIPPGVTLVRGGDGRGKTTLLEMLAGVTPTRAGALHIGDLDLATQPDAYRAQLSLTRPGSLALEDITPDAWFGDLADRYPGFNRDALADLSEGLALEPHRAKSGNMLSAGTKRKVWLAGAFASGAAVTLLDEPFAALDRASIGFVLELLEEAALSGRAWVVADYEAPRGVPLAAEVDLGD